MRPTSLSFAKDSHPPKAGSGGAAIGIFAVLALVLLVSTPLFAQ